MIYIVRATFRAGPGQSFATKSKTAAARHARDFAFAGASGIDVMAYKPFPRKLPWPSEGRCLGNGLDAICAVLNGDWYSSAELVAQFSDLDKKPCPDIYTRVGNAKVKP